MWKSYWLLSLWEEIVQHVKEGIPAFLLNDFSNLVTGGKAGKFTDGSLKQNCKQLSEMSG